jgi:hypothetical protein
MSCSNQLKKIHRSVGVFLSDQLTTELKYGIDCRSYSVKFCLFKEMQSSNGDIQGIYELHSEGKVILLQLQSNVLQSLAGALLNRKKKKPRPDGSLTMIEQFIGKKVVAYIRLKLSETFSNLELKKQVENIHEIYSYYSDSDIQQFVFSIKLNNNVIGDIIINYLKTDLNALELEGG